MTLRSLHILLTVAWVLSICIALISIIFAIALPLLNEHLLTTWSVIIDVNHDQSLLHIGPNAAWSIEQNQGVMLVETTTLGLGLNRAFYILVVWGVVLAVIGYLRRIVRDVQSQRPFNLQGIKYIQRTGWLLMMLSVWLYIEVFIRFYLFVPNAFELSEFKFNHIQIFQDNVAEVAIYPEFNVGLFVTGLFVMVIAEAFKRGLDLQRDSDEII